MSLSIWSRGFFLSQRICVQYIYTRELVCDDERIGRACGCVCVCFLCMYIVTPKRARARRFMRLSSRPFFCFSILQFRVYSVPRPPASVFVHAIVQKSVYDVIIFPVVLVGVTFILLLLLLFLVRVRVASVARIFLLLLATAFLDVVVVVRRALRCANSCTYSLCTY
jgi:hypothetical protein